MLSMRAFLMLGFALGVLCIEAFNSFALMYASILVFMLYTVYEDVIVQYMGDNFVLLTPKDRVARVEHDRRRSLTYPDHVSNSWYHVCDSKDLLGDKVIEVRALGQVFALWRTKDGKPVCQDAYCLHLGANLAVGGKVVDDCLQCPFHKWKFAADGTVTDVPYIPDKTKCPTKKKLKTYPCVDWCGLVCVYFHADEEEPEFLLPKFIEDELERDDWMPHLSWDLGFKTLSPVDWVDQAGDHAHFHTLHADFLVPWTLIPLPQWFQKLVPLGICHHLVTYLGDDSEWKQRVAESNWGTPDKYYIYFTDEAGLTWKGKRLEFSLSQTTELFVGPAIMVFHIPFTIGTLKAFVTTTPTEGGSVMKVRTWVDGRVKHSFWKKYVAWFLTGISASQLVTDIEIMCNKIRMKKPILQPFDGPYNRTNTWLKQFYSKSSKIVNEAFIGTSCSGYKNDW